MIEKKRTWKECEDKKIVQVYEEVKAEAQRLYPEYFENCVYELYIDGSTKHLGQCQYEYNKSTIYNKYGYKNHFGFLRNSKVVILLSKYVDADHARNTLVHEFGHAVTPSEGHSSSWLNRANKIGAKWGETCNRLAEGEDLESFRENKPERKYKYAIECPQCGRQWKYQRLCYAVEHPSRYRCSVCKVNLVRGTEIE